MKIIAEIGVNHHGIFRTAVDLTRSAKLAGADAVKFQLFNPDLLTANREEAAMLKKLILTREEHLRLVDVCHGVGIEYICTPFDEGSADWLVEKVGVKTIKISSGDATNLRLIRHCGNFGLPMLISTGFCSEEEVYVAYLEANNAGSGPVTMMHCVPRYPTDDRDADLTTLAKMRHKFGRVGYSDHTTDILSALSCAHLLDVLEKHLTGNRQAAGPDHAASIEWPGFRELVNQIRRIETMWSPPRDTSTAVYDRAVIRRGLYLRADIPAGEVVRTSDAIPLRPLVIEGLTTDSDGLSFRSTRDLRAGEPLKWSDVK